jgi:8-amino-7-oxononanoate synthase
LQLPSSNALAPNPSIMHSAPGPHTIIDGRELLYFAGTGYLGLQSDPRLIAAAQAASESYGIHTATTRSGYGNSPPVLEVEHRAAEFLAAEEACYLVTGYAVNFALAAALNGGVDLVLIDESAHDCLREATRWFDGLERPPLAFRHRDPGHVDELLRGEVRSGGRVLLMTDGVFAASGRLAPLQDYLALLTRHSGAILLVDDAHGLAVLGAEGRGSLELAGVAPSRVNAHLPGDPTSPDSPAIYHGTTLSKAVGGHGGAIAGSRGFLTRVRNASGWFRGASAPAAPVAAATARALEIVQAEPALRHQLSANVAQTRSALRGLGLDIEDSPSPIVSFQLADPDAMQQLQQRLFAAGIAVAYTRNYAGAGPDGMLRIAVFATHTPQMIGQLADTLGRVL